MIIDDDALDPEVRSAMEALTPYPARNPEDEAHGLQNFLAAAQMVRLSSSQVTIPRRKVLARLPRSQRAPAQRPRTNRLGLKALAVSAFLLLVVFFGASGVTTLAARGALPGEPLYPVKTSLEKLRVTLNSDRAGSAELHLIFAQRRLDEISLLVLENRFENLQSTAELFRYHLQEAMKAMQGVAAEDPARAQTLALAVTELAADAIEILSHLRALAPEAAAPAIDQALSAMQLDPEGNAFTDILPATIPGAPSPEATPLPAGATTTEEALSPATATPSMEITLPPNSTPAEGLPATPIDAAATQQAGVFDIDIHSIKISAPVKMETGDPIRIQLEIKNKGVVEGEGTASVRGVQGGVEVYNQSLPVSDSVGGTFHRYSFPDFVPTASGEIVWTVTLIDGDPDADEAVEVTAVSIEGEPGAGEPGRLDLDIHFFKIPAVIKLKKGGAIEIQLDIKNNGLAGGQGTVTITGMQNGIEIYTQTLTVTDPVGGGQSRYIFPKFTPGAAGEIEWTVTLNDGDPDDDTVIATTQVEQ